MLTDTSLPKENLVTDKMRLHSKLESSAANGPGNRAVIWFQGCTLACPGCHNPETHSFDVAETPINEVENWLDRLNYTGIEGVTFSGGEPMQHLYELRRLCRFVRNFMPGKSIGMFTGYTLKELEISAFRFRARRRGDC
jgi:anaerobic ribonucleoside-triphosphate reductase activating protein